MERKVIEIAISPETLEEEISENAGVMWEHNATKIIFSISREYIGDYRYYIEYRSLIGTADRTYNLTLNESDNTVTFDIPVEMSSLMSVECYFNIVRVNGAGETVQVIKPKKFCLDFSPSYDTDNTLAKINGFTVNKLLEAIRNNTFKGEKGDKGDRGEKGDTYSITDNDRTIIAIRMQQEIFGLPFVREIAGSGKSLLHAVAENAQVYELTVTGSSGDFSAASETSPADPNKFSKMRLILGKNEIEYLLKPEMYSSFEHDTKIFDKKFYVVPVILNPNTEYMLMRSDKKHNNINLYIMADGEDAEVYIDRKNTAKSKDYMTFLTGESGLAYIIAEKIGDSYEVYRDLLENDLYAFGIYEAEKVMDVDFDPPEPFYAISDKAYDSIDFISGKLVKQIEEYLVPTNIPAENIKKISMPGGALYRYLLPLTVTPDPSDDYNIVSTHYKPTDIFVNTVTDAVKLEKTNYTGLYFDRKNLKIYIYTKKSPEDFALFIDEQQSAGTPITVLYKKQEPVLIYIETGDLSISNGYESIMSCPKGVNYRLRANGDISYALNYVLNKIK